MRDEIHEIRDRGAELVIVGNGALNFARAFREDFELDVPLLIDHFRYFAGCLRAQEGTATEMDANTVCYHFHEPLGVVGQIIPWNFPLLMAGWKLAPALAAGPTPTT